MKHITEMITDIVLAPIVIVYLLIRDLFL